IKRVQFVRVTCAHLRARAALGVAEETKGSERDALLRRVLADARRIERERAPWAVPYGTLLRAGVAALEGKASAARADVERAIAAFDTHAMGLHAQVARRALGALVGGDEGRAHVERADAWMRAQMIREPAPFARTFAPGLPR